jgi:hypothetical protein
MQEITQLLRDGASFTVDVLQDKFPMIWAAVRQRVFAVSIVGISIGGMLIVLGCVLGIMGWKRSRKYPADICDTTCAIFAFSILSLVIGVFAVILNLTDLLSLDYATMRNIMKLMRGGK